MRTPRWLPFLVALPALYVGVAGFRAHPTKPSSLLLFALALAIAIVGGRRKASEPRALLHARLGTTASLSVAIATAALASRPAWAAFAREVACLLGMLAAVLALATIDKETGLATKASEATKERAFGRTNLARVVLVALVGCWGPSVLLDGAHAFRAVGHHLRGLSPAIAAASGGTALVALALSALVLAAVRRFELAARTRALAGAGAAAMGLGLGLSLITWTDLEADAAICIGGAAASAATVRLASAPDALVLARRGRRVLALACFGGPLIALLPVVSHGQASGAVLVLALAVGLLLVGAGVRRLEKPFLPMRGALLRALGEARSATQTRESREAIVHALEHLRDATSHGRDQAAAASPELWLLHPTRVLTINMAGYLHEAEGALPVTLFDVALAEPHATLRTSMLRALEVRRADLRPLLAWLDQRAALFATVIIDDKEPAGLLVVPAGTRQRDLALEEAHAAKALADATVAVTQAMSAHARHLEREHELRTSLEALDKEAAQLRHRLELESGRHAHAAERIARTSMVGTYSAATRMAYEALERRVESGAPALLVARAGSEPASYVARAHLASPRKNGPLVVVEGTSTREHVLERWTEEHSSPLALAEGGLLLVLDVAALPHEVQVVIARALSSRRAPWNRERVLDVAFAASATHPVNMLLDPSNALLAPELAAHFDASAAIVLPGLCERAEDLRAILVDRLAREGLRVRSRPVGLDAGAFARLVEYPFPGEDAELSAIVTRLVAAAREDVIRAADVDALGLAVPQPV